MDAWDYLTTTPVRESDRLYRLKGDYATGTFQGETFDRYQYKITNGGRTWYFVRATPDAKTAGRVLLERRETGHPKETERKQPFLVSELDAPTQAIMGAPCTHCGYDGVMSKVMQIRDVPDDVHDALAEAAQTEGLSLTRYMQRELEHLAKRTQAVRDNAAVIRRTQADVRGRSDRDTILSVLHEGRGE